jgi:chromosome segregation ATPase
MNRISAEMGMVKKETERKEEDIRRVSGELELARRELAGWDDRWVKHQAQQEELIKGLREGLSERDDLRKEYELLNNRYKAAKNDSRMLKKEIEEVGSVESSWV